MGAGGAILQWLGRWRVGGCARDLGGHATRGRRRT